MRTISELYSIEGRIYLFINSSQAYKHFSETAGKEGFTLPEGEDDVLHFTLIFRFATPVGLDI